MDLAADLPEVVGDPVQLQQVVLNLLLNGAVAFLRKPFTDQHLLEAIDAAVRRGPAEGGTV